MPVATPPQPTNTVILPPPNAPFVTADGKIERAWYLSLRQIISSIGGFSTTSVSNSDLQQLTDENLDIATADLPSITTRLSSLESLVADIDLQNIPSLQDVTDALSLAYTDLDDATLLAAPMINVVANKLTDTTSANATLTTDAALTVPLNVGRYNFELFLGFYEATLGTGGFQFDLNAGNAVIGAILYGMEGFATAALAVAAATAITTVQSSATIARQRPLRRGIWPKVN